MKRNFIRNLSAAFMLVAALGVSGVQAQSPKKGGSIIMLVKPEPPTLASYRSTAGPVGQVADKIYDGLLEYNLDLSPKPGLAESWTVSADGKTITFKLHKGVTFHNGSPFTSADVKYTINEVLRKIHPRAALTFREVKSIDTPDDHTVILNLNNPAPYLMTALSGHETPIISKKVFEGTDPKNNPTANKPIGTGPFKFTEWKKGQYIRLDRNDQYWRWTQQVDATL